MTPSDTDVAAVPDELLAALPELVRAYSAHRTGRDVEGAPRVLDAEMMRAGRPGIVDVVAVVGADLVHAPFALRSPSDEVRILPEGDDAVLGTAEDGDGTAVVLPATRDPEAAALLLERVMGESVDPALVRPLYEGMGSVTLAMNGRFAFTVYHEVVDGGRPDLELLLALDAEGFNHLPAPLSVWRRGGRDLGVVQELLASASSGMALALTSVRDLYASGGPPDMAGGDFGAEAHRIGTMAARMHLALDRAFGRRRGDVGLWAEDIVRVLEARAEHVLGRPDVEELLEQLRALDVPSELVRPHGDLHLGRTCRTEQGWYVVDFANGGQPVSPAGAVEDGEAGVFRSPLADVADMLWSFGYVANAAAEERDPTGRDGLNELADAWVDRNRRAFLAGYLGVPGISGLVPPGREALRIVTAAFELVRAAVHAVPDSVL
jgi:maltokinase